MNSFPVSLSQRRAQGLVTTVLVALALALLAFAADSMVATLATAAETHKVTLTGRDIAVYNLAGKARLEAGSGSAVVVTVNQLGADADRLTLEQSPIAGRTTLRIVYPRTRIIYPEMGRGSNTTIRVREDGTFGGDDRKDWGFGQSGTIRISGSGDGTEAHADLAVSIPRGQKFSLFLACGTVNVTNVDGDLKVDTGSGSVSSTGTRGVLSIDTGSGEINVGGADGTVNLDTGSGDVNVSAVEGDHLLVDTGSGGIRARDIHVHDIRLDTGSGDVEVADLSAEEVSIDTGSGAVEVQLNAMANSIAVDTGSGDVTLRVPKTAGAEILFDTGSGGFDSDLPITLRKREHGSWRGRIGDGAARVVVETGSGDLNVAANTSR